MAKDSVPDSQIEKDLAYVRWLIPRKWPALARDEDAYADMVQAGALGLLEARKRFDGSRGYSFLTYAHHWVTREIRHEIRRRNTVHTPVRKKQRAQMERLVEQTHGRADRSDQLLTRISVRKLMSESLNPHQFVVLSALFGINGYVYPRSPLSVSKKLRLSRQRIDQIKHEALKRLRYAIKIRKPVTLKALLHVLENSDPQLADPSKNTAD